VYGILESPGKIAVAGDAVTFAIEGVFAGPVTEDHFGIFQEVAIDGNVLAVDGQWSYAQPVSIDMVCWFAGGAFA
jgi:acetyltransferase-like isoleucine patch superfamily enzyme